MSARVVDVLVHLATSRFDRPLTYRPGGPPLQVREVVRVPLGPRDVFAYCVSVQRPAVRHQVARCHRAPTCRARSTKPG